MTIYLQLTLLILSAILTTSFFSKKSIAFLISFLFAVILTAQVASVLFSGNLIDLRFFNHLTLDDMTFAGDFFLRETLTLAAILIASPFLIFYTSRKWRDFFSKRQWITVVLLGLSVVLMSLSGGLLRQLYEVGSLKTADSKSFEQALNDLNIPIENYILPTQIEAQAGKNIIVLALESYEKGFLEDKLAHLSPNLRKLKEKMVFLDMPMDEGSSWTAGAMYTSITGVPAYFRAKNNSIFQKTSEVKLTGISHVLKKAGYDVSWLLAGKEFAGMDAMMGAFDIEVKSDDNYNYSSNEWGMHDRDLFEAAQKELLEMKKTNNPFAFFISTVSTHNPDGIYDSRFEGEIEPQRTRLEFMAAAVDKLIGDFFQFLEKENLLDNTVVYIFPDHLLMGLQSTVLNDFSSPRSLYVMTNAEQNNLTYPTNEKIYQIDIPKLILEGAAIKHNARFLTDFIGQKDKPTFLKNNRSNLLALNEAALRRNSFENGITIERNNLGRFILKSGYHTEVIPEMVEKNELYAIYLDAEYRLEKIETGHAVKVFQPQSQYTTLILQFKRGKIYAYLRKNEYVGIVKEDENQIVFSKEEMNLAADWKIDYWLSSLPERPKYQTPFDFIYLTSSIGGAAQINTPSEIRIGDKNFPLKKGMNLLLKKEGNFEVLHFETQNSPDAVRSLLQKIDERKANKDFFALIVQESAGRVMADFKKEWRQRGFHFLGDLKQGRAYVAYSVKGLVSESTKEKTVSISLPTQFDLGNRSDEQIWQQANDPERFIAHAGGQIEGHTYTNTLEALNLSYENGFRLFELDIIKTKDGQYVAAHDWNSWKHKASYKGSFPVTKEEFLKHKIKGKFTPLDMEAINEWFAAHPDAILVTDKVNDPADFAAQFVDKNRLMMELFSLEAVKKGLAVGIRSAIPSENVVDKIEGDKVTFLKNLGVTHIAVSRRKIADNITFFKALQAADIKPYVYHVNQDAGKDELYVVLNEMGLIYGLYADKWRLE